VIPISSHQDTVGPMTRIVADSAILLSVIAGPDPSDDATITQPQPVPDYRKALNPEALHGVRLGVPRKFLETDTNILAAFNESIAVMRKLGAVIVDPAEFPNADELLASKDSNEDIVIGADFKVSRGGALTAQIINFDNWARLMSTNTSLVSWTCLRALETLQISLVLTFNMLRKNSYLLFMRINLSQFTS